MSYIANKSGILSHTRTLQSADFSDTADFPGAEDCVGVFVESAGAYSLRYNDGEEDVLTLPAGFVLPAQIVRVKATGTTTTTGVHTLHAGG